MTASWTAVPRSEPAPTAQEPRAHQATRTAARRLEELWATEPGVFGWLGTVDHKDPSLLTEVDAGHGSVGMALFIATEAALLVMIFWA